MPLIEPSECLTALLIGLHYAKSRFTIANFFNEILDSVAELPSFQTRSIGPHSLVFRVGSINATFTPEAFVINSHLTIGKDLLAHMPKRDEKYIALPAAVYDDKFEIRKGIEGLKESPKTFRRNFVEECIEIIRLVDKIVQGGLSPFRFVGLVEYYAVPLDRVCWDVLERFTKEADIPGGSNTEKIAINRYYFPATKEEDERCLIFKLVRPDDHREREPAAGGASFDFQFIPEKPKTIAEFGGPKEMVTSLAIGIQKMIDHSKFMNFTPRK
jgi:hypothetical protein